MSSPGATFWVSATPIRSTRSLRHLWALTSHGRLNKAPVLILGVTRTRFARNGNPNNYALYDLGAATAFLILQATAMGLVTHQMAGFDQDATRKGLGIPEEYALGSVMALGYRSEE